MKNITLCAAAALSLLPGLAFGQDATTAATPMMPSPHIFETTPAPVSERLDYTLEFNNTFNRTDLTDAKIAHLSDRQVATVYKLARLSQCKFCDILALVIDGKTFISICEIKGIPPYELNHVQKEEDEINAYESAYAATGLGNVPRPYRVMSSIDSIKK
jgi:hypothetical protein